MIDKRKLLFLTIMIEGYVVLAIELLAMRTLIPFVGSGTEVVAIVISSVLLPMAVGYNLGGTRYKRQYISGKTAILSIRRILLKNILASLVILTIGLSYMFQELFFIMLVKMGIRNHILQTFIFCGAFLVYPVFLLAQTIPLLSNFFSSEHLSRVTGRMLFFSTVGSFGGSVFSTLILMSFLGVHVTLIITLSLLSLVMLLLTKMRYTFENITAIIFIGLAVFMNSPQFLRQSGIVADTQYSTIKVFDEKLKMGSDIEENWKVYEVNTSAVLNALSSAVSESGKLIPVHDFIMTNLIPKDGKDKKPLNILVLGAAGFALGMNDTFNHYVFVDIDPAVKKVAEEHFLPQPLQKNKDFVAMSGRAFLKQTEEKYDLIILDLFSNVLSIPQEAVTREFLYEVKQHVATGGIVASNVASDADYKNKFSVRYYNTFASVFPNPSKQIIGDFNPWREKRGWVSHLYMYFDRPFVGDNTVYTDDLNSYSLDK